VIQNDELQLVLGMRHSSRHAAENMPNRLYILVPPSRLFFLFTFAIGQPTGKIDLTWL
jgi:hypothetical protein